jgi:predicted kinase
MKLINILVEASASKPKVVIMAGGAGVGKSTLLNKLDLGSLPHVNPDKYVEDPEHPAYNNLSQGARLADQEAEELSSNRETFVWDTTASNPKKVKDLLNKGYDAFMVMVYTHPMISYISNSKRERKVPGAAVFSTWRNVYQLIGDYSKMLKGNLAISVNDRGGEYSKEIEAFNTAAKNGPQGIKEYLQKYNEANNIGGSTFRKPIEMSQEEEEEFLRATSDVDYDKENYGEDRAVKDAFLKAYQKNGVGPGDDKLRDAIKKYRDRKEKQEQREADVLENIAEMLFSPVFQELLQHSTPQEIDQKVQEFLT